MSASKDKLRIGFIPLVDAASLLIAADKGFAAEERLDVELVREVSWANIREKLNAGIFDAAHMLTPMAIASALRVGQPIQTRLLAPLTLAINGNAITLSHRLYDAIIDESGGKTAPLDTAKALARVVRRREKRNEEPLSFGMTFPFSSHNYQLRLWMAAGGIDPDEEVRLLVLPPPYMVESLESGQVDGFCVGAPWNSLAVDLGIGRILHLGSEIVHTLAEKVLAVRSDWAGSHRTILLRLMTAVMSGAEYLSQEENWPETARLLARPDRVGVKEHLIMRALSGILPAGFNGVVKSDRRYLVPATSLDARPDERQAKWIYEQMLHWRQISPDRDASKNARRVFAPGLFDEAFPGLIREKQQGEPLDGVGAFTTL